MSLQIDVDTLYPSRKMYIFAHFSTVLQQKNIKKTHLSSFWPLLASPHHCSFQKNLTQLNPVTRSLKPLLHLSLIDGVGLNFQRSDLLRSYSTAWQPNLADVESKALPAMGCSNEIEMVSQPDTSGHG